MLGDGGVSELWKHRCESPPIDFIGTKIHFLVSSFLSKVKFGCTIQKT
jgi:hypothetical protein